MIMLGASLESLRSLMGDFVKSLQICNIPLTDQPVSGKSSVLALVGLGCNSNAYWIDFLALKALICTILFSVLSPLFAE